MSQMGPEDVAQLGAVVERRSDLGQRHPQLAERHDPVQAADVRVAVQPVPCLGALARDEDADLL